jgi:glycosyltransferase involved in cell wall biosynthesis
MTIVIDATPITPGNSAGVETFAYGLLRGLSVTPGESVQALVQAGTRPAWERQTPDFSNYVEIKSFLNADATWQRLLRKVTPDVVARTPLAGHLRRLRARSVDAGRDDTAGLTYYPFHRTPATAETFVMTVHDLRPFQPEFASPLDQSIIAQNMSRATAVVCSWPHPYADAQRLFPEHTAKIFMSPLPIFNPPVGDFTPHVVNRSAPTLLYPAGIAPHKNHENLVRAMADLPTARLVCTGPPTEPLLGRLKGLVNELGLADRVEFTGFVSAAELQEQFANCDAVIIPTRWEAASGPLFEALAWRKPVIASRIGPVTAQLRFAGAEAHLFDPESPDAIAQAVKDWQSGPDPDYSDLNEWIWKRDWAAVATDYRRVFDWARGLDKPTDLQPSLDEETRA